MAEPHETQDDWEKPDDGRGHLPEEIERAIVGDVTKKDGFFNAQIDMNQLPRELREQIMRGFENPMIIIPGKGIVAGGDRLKGLSWTKRHVLLRRFQGKKPILLVRLLLFFHRHLFLTILILVLVIVTLLAYCYS